MVIESSRMRRNTPYIFTVVHSLSLSLTHTHTHTHTELKA